MPYISVTTKIPLAVSSRCVFTYAVNKITLAKRLREPMEVMSRLLLIKFSRNS
jgi:hypothetical protein